MAPRHKKLESALAARAIVAFPRFRKRPCAWRFATICQLWLGMGAAGVFEDC
jgi:hypothetical protein